MARKQTKKQHAKINSKQAVIGSRLNSLKAAYQKAYHAKKFDESLALASEITQQYPEHSEGWILRADALARVKQLSSAVKCMQEALKLSSLPTLNHQLKLAQYQVVAGEAANALPLLERLSNEHDKRVDVQSWLSQAYHALGKNVQALAANDRAIALDKNNVEVLLWRSRILDNLKQSTKARDMLLKIKELAPREKSVNNHLGSLAMREGNYEQAEQYFYAELALEDNSQVFSNLVIAKHYNPNYSAEDLKNSLDDWAMRYQHKEVRQLDVSLNPAKRLRIGLLSGGFRVHPVGQMVLPALENLSSSDFELVVYSTNQVKDFLSLEIESQVSNWKIIESLNNHQLGELIGNDKIDILIDMNGGGDGSRYPMLSSKPSPLIVKWVGMLINTTGIRGVDYLLSDSIETPQGVDGFYTEKLIRMPDDYICYKIPDYIPSVNGLPALANQYITFGCLNSPAKLSPQLIQEWAQLIKEVPNSKLLLRGIQFEAQEFCQKIIDSFQAHGIDETRLILEGPAKHEEFIKTYQRIDIALDTWPYSGGLTTCEALAMGVPVVTCVGPTFAGRHSATHLANAGLPELVTDSWDDFRKRVKELANDLPSLAVIRAALRTILTESPVCDGERFAKHLTTALRGIWQRHCEGKPPEALTFNKAGEAWFADQEQAIELVEVEAEPEPQEAVFKWNLESPITVIDNGALFARHENFADWMQTGNFAVITFDPGSLLTKQAEELKQLGEWHHYAHATLGDGSDVTLYATLSPEHTGTLKPLAKHHYEKQSEQLRVLSELPISTVPLNAIDGLPGVDMLVLDDLNDAMAILENGGEYLKETLVIQVKVAFQPTHDRQPNLAELQQWASRNGFRFYRLHNIQHYSHLPENLNAISPYATEQESADVLFLPSYERMAALSNENKTRLAFILSAGFAAHDLAFELVADVSQEKALKFLDAQELLPKASTPLVTKNAGNKDFLATQLKQTDTAAISTFIPASETTPPPESQYQIDLESLKQQFSDVLNHVVSDEELVESASNNKKIISRRLVYLEYPLIYGVEWAGKGVKLALEETKSEIKVIDSSKDIINEIVLANKSDIIFTGHSFYNITMKSPPYIQQDTNVFDIFNVVPFAIVDDHSYADFMLQRCKKAPQEIIMGSTSANLLDEFEAVSISKKVHKIQIPSKSPEVDSVPFEQKKTRAVFLGKLYDNVPKDKASLESKVLSDNRLSENDKSLIFKMINGREGNPFFSLPSAELYVNDLSLLYYDLVDKFFRNFYRNQELGKIACAFKERNIPVHVIGGEESSWSFKGKQNCVFWPKMEYKEAISFLHNSKYNINLTPSYADVLTGRAIDMMGSNALCVSDYSPYYEQLEKKVIYFGSSFIGSSDFFEENVCKLAGMQKDYIYKLFGEERVIEEWRKCIEKACEILNKKTIGNSNELDRRKKGLQKSKAVVTDLQLQKIKQMHAAEIKRLKGKEKIRVVFLVIHRSVWKVDTVFQKMLRDPIFEPIILVCPDINKNNDALTFSEINETYTYFKEKGYKVFSSWMKNKKQWRSLDSLKPDLLFFTNPHGLTHPEYYDKAFTRFLTCYVPYTYQVAKYERGYQFDYNQVFHNLAWRIYAPHNESLRISRQHADNKGSNVVVTGYPLIGDLLNSDNEVCVWKEQEVTKKKIIWAPHHTINDENKALPFSNFEKLSGFMMELAENYKDQVQWAFKPHPLLKEKMYREASWGKEVTDNYYSYWACSEHTQLEEGDYKDLFRASDALIHDSVSFLAEYLVLDKPVMFFVNKDVKVVDFLTPFGLRAYNASHHGSMQNDITEFIESILGEVDLGKEARRLFLSNNLEVEQFDSPSRKIVDDLKDFLFSC